MTSPMDAAYRARPSLPRWMHSLHRLGMDYVDLYQIHRFDHETPIEETLEALHDVVKAGKARYIGASSMFAWQFCKALDLAERHGWTRFISMQNHYNLLYREEEREMMPLCQTEKIGVIPWSPLARGRLTRPWEEQSASDRAGKDEFGKTLYTKSVDSDRQVIDRVGEIAASRKVTRTGRGAGLDAQQTLRHLAYHRGNEQQHLDDAIAASNSSSRPRTSAGSKSPMCRTRCRDSRDARVESVQHLSRLTAQDSRGPAALCRPS